MKNLIKLFLLLSLLLTSGAFAQGFYSVFSKDGSNVFAAGKGGIVFRSTDGGATFRSFSLGVNDLYGIYEVNMRVWVAGQDGIYISSDDGGSFNLTPFSGTTLKSVFFLDENTGWVAGINGFVAMSTNGGINWTTQSSGTMSTLNSVKFLNPTSGIACGTGGALIYTTNGGVMWNVFLDLLTSKELFTVDIKGTTAIATGADAFILKSTNSGASWSYIDYKILTKSQVRGVSMINQNTFYSCGGGGFIRKSADGGNSFTFQINPMMADLSSIYFLDSLKGWAVSSKNNAVISTSDGGNTWQLPTNTTVTFAWSEKLVSGGNIGNTLARHPQNKNGMFVVSGSAVYRSFDLGETWTQISTISFSGEAHSFYVYPKDTNLFIASIGDFQGRVVKSTDYGMTWASVWGPAMLTDYGVPMVMDPSQTNIVYLAPNASPLLRSTDFGNTWSSWSTNSFFDPCDVVVVFDNSNLMYFGDQGGGGKFYKSTDGGINWNLMINVGGAEVPMIGANNLDNNLIFFTNWAGAGLWRSTNAGVNWANIYSLNSAWGADVAKDDPMAFAFGTYGGSIFISTNGGDNFTITAPSDGTNYGLYFYDRGTLIAQQAGGIFKLSVIYDVPVLTNRISTKVPKEFALFQNYPNPFNPTTKIRFSIPPYKGGQGDVLLKVYDLLGREVATLVSEKLQPGNYEVEFPAPAGNATNFSSGIYFYKLTTENYTETKKMVLIK